MQSSHPIIVEKLTHQYNSSGEPVLEDIDFSVRQGEFVGILGPNGSGKTTLLKIILGMIRPSSGKVSLFGTNVSHFKNWTKIGFIPQKATQQVDKKFPITVREVVALGKVGKRGLFRRLSNKDYSDVDSILAKVGLTEKKDFLMSELSGGQQQRVFIAKALVSNPDLLILDEPTVGVDSQSQKDFYNLLEELNHKSKISIILVSHDTDTVANLVDTVICLNRRMVCHVSSKKFAQEGMINLVHGDEFKHHLTHNH